MIAPQTLSAPVLVSPDTASAARPGACSSSRCSTRCSPPWPTSSWRWSSVSQTSCANRARWCWRRSSRNAGTIRAAYYAFTLSSVLFVPIAIFARRGTAWRMPGLIDVAAAFGLFAGFARVLGFGRWPLYVPYLAESFSAAEPGSARADGMVLLYEAANRNSGMTVGEHLGWLFQGLWLVCLGIAVASQQPGTAWLGWLGTAIGVMILVGAGEQFQAGLEGLLGAVNAVATTAPPFWLIGLGVWLVREQRFGTAHGIEQGVRNA